MMIRFLRSRVLLASYLMTALLGCDRSGPSASKATTAPAASSAPSAVRIERVTYREWADCYRLTNGTVELVVVPAVGGRIMRYGFVGGENAIWEPPPGPPAAGADPANRGGDKVWLWPQDDWKPALGRAWPPPGGFDALPHAATVVDDSTLRLTSPRFGPEGLQIVRDIRLASDGTRVDFDIRLESQSANSKQAWSLWTVTQVPTADELVARLAPGSTKAPRWIFQYGPGKVHSRSEDEVAIEMPTGEKSKLLIDACALSARRGRMLFVQTFERGATDSREKPNDRAQVYSNPAPPQGQPPGPYEELEFTSAPRLVTVSSPGVLKLSWTLRESKQDQGASQKGP